MSVCAQQWSLSNLVIPNTSFFALVSGQTLSNRVKLKPDLTEKVQQIPSKENSTLLCKVFFILTAINFYFVKKWINYKMHSDRLSIRGWLLAYNPQTELDVNKNRDKCHSQLCEVAVPINLQPRETNTSNDKCLLLHWKIFLQNKTQEYNRFLFFQNKTKIC